MLAMTDGSSSPPKKIKVTTKRTPKRKNTTGMVAKKKLVMDKHK